MKIIFALLLTVCACFGQYGLRPPYVLLTTSTNSVLLANTNQSVNLTVDVAAGHRAELIFAFKLTDATNIGTNPIVLTFDKALESPYFTNQFTVSLAAKTNALAWTNVTIGTTNDVYLRLVSVTNHNAVSATNVLVKLFQKTGL